MRSMTDPALAELVRATAEATLAGDTAALEHLLAPDFVETYPQSRERVRGADTILRILSEHPSAPRGIRPPRVTTLSDELAITESQVAYGDDPWWVIGIYRAGDGRIQAERAYFGEPLEAQAWRQQWVVPIPADPGYGDSGHGGVERDTAERYFHAQATSDFAEMARLRHEDFVHDMPQSGERFPTAQAYVEAHQRYPGGLPVLEPLTISGPEDQWVVAASPIPVRVSGSGAHWVGEAEVVYPNGDRWFEILLMAFRDGRVAAERSYWGEPFDPPEWRIGISESY